MKRTLFWAALMAAAFGLSACDNDGAFEEAGEEIDEAAEEIEDEIDDEV